MPAYLINGQVVQSPDAGNQFTQTFLQAMQQEMQKKQQEQQLLKELMVRQQFAQENARLENQFATERMGKEQQYQSQRDKEAQDRAVANLLLQNWVRQQGIENERSYTEGQAGLERQRGAEGQDLAAMRASGLASTQPMGQMSYTPEDKGMASQVYDYAKEKVSPYIPQGIKTNLGLAKGAYDTVAGLFGKSSVEQPPSPSAISAGVGTVPQPQAQMIAGTKQNVIEPQKITQFIDNFFMQNKKSFNNPEFEKTVMKIKAIFTDKGINPAVIDSIIANAKAKHGYKVKSNVKPK